MLLGKTAVRNEDSWIHRRGKANYDKATKKASGAGVVSQELRQRRQAFVPLIISQSCDACSIQQRGWPWARQLPLTETSPRWGLSFELSAAKDSILKGDICTEFQSIHGNHPFALVGLLALYKKFIPSANSFSRISLNKFREMLVGQFIVLAAAADLRAIVDNHCLTPLLSVPPRIPHYIWSSFFH